MPIKINKIAVIGTGVIGTGWIIRMLAHNKKVSAFDLNLKQKSILYKEIKRSSGLLNDNDIKLKSIENENLQKIFYNGSKKKGKY